MATSRSLGTLTLDLIANIGGFTDAMSKAARQSADSLNEIEKQFSEFSESISGILEAVGIGVGLKEITDKIGETIEAMDQLGKSAQKVGLPVDEFSQLAAAAQLSNVSIDELQATLGKLSKSEAQALDATSQQGKIFAALGISVKDANGQLKSSADVMEEFADKFQELGVNSTTTAAGIELFGKNFQDLIPFLQQGKEGIEAAKEEAVELGATLSGDAAKAAAQFEDDLTKIKLAGTGVWNQLAQQLLPTLNEWADDIVDLAKDHKDLDAVGQGLNDTLRVLAAIGIEVAAGFKVITAAVETLTVAIAASVDAFSLAQDAYSHPLDVQNMKKDFSQIISNAAAARDQVANIWTNATTALDKYQDAALKQLNAIGQNAKKTQDTVANAGQGDGKDHSAQLKKLQDALNPKSAQNAEALAEAMQKLADAVAKVDESADPTAKAYNQYADTIRQIDQLGADAIKKGASVIQVQGLVAQAVASAQQKLATDLAAPMKAAQAYDDALDQQLKTRQQLIDLQVQSIGMGDKEAQNYQELAKIQEQGAQAVADFTKKYANQLAANDPQYTDELSHLKQFWADSYTIAKSGQDAIANAQSDWMNGVDKAWANFVAQQNNAAQIASQLTTDFLNQGSDAFASFIDGTKSAKDALKDFINNFEQEISQAVSKQLLKQLFSIGSDSGSGGSGARLFDYIGSFFNGSGGSSFFPSFATGGTVAAGSLARVNENGPELLSVGGKDYLMMGAQTGRVTANNKIAGGGVTQVNNYQFAAPTSQRTQTQMAQKTSYDLRRAQRLG